MRAVEDLFVYYWVMVAIGGKRRVRNSEKESEGESEGEENRKRKTYRNLAVLISKELFDNVAKRIRA